MKRALAPRQDPPRGARGDAAALPRSRPAGASACRRCGCSRARRRRSRRSPQRLAPAVAAARRRRLRRRASIDCASQIGSGALPLETMPSAGLAIRPAANAAAGARSSRSPAAFRRLPMPVIGRIEDGALVLDLRCLEDEAGLRRATSPALPPERSPMRWLDRLARRRADADPPPIEHPDRRADGARIRGRAWRRLCGGARDLGAARARRRRARAEQCRRLLRRRARRRARSRRWRCAG